MGAIKMAAAAKQIGLSVVLEAQAVLARFGSPEDPGVRDRRRRPPAELVD